MARPSNCVSFPQLLLTPLPADTSQEALLTTIQEICKKAGLLPPVQVTVVRAISRGYIELPNVHTALQVMHSAQGTLHLGSTPVTLAYAESPSGQKLPKEDSGDWYCLSCDAYNFPRRTKCFKCAATRSTVRSEAEVTRASVMAKSPAFTSATEDQVRLLFEHFARVRDIRLVKDRVTGLNKSFAFVEFATAAEADSAVFCGEQGCIKLHGDLVTVVHSRGKKRESELPAHAPAVPLFTVPSQIAASGEFRVPAHYKWDGEKGMYYDCVADGYWDQASNLFYLYRNRQEGTSACLRLTHPKLQTQRPAQGGTHASATH